jgi:predicted nuclease of predicted toxin-antitoxin system
VNERIRFHLDESADADIATGSRRLGIDVTTTWEVGLSGQMDLMQLDFARHEQRVIVTHDADFLRLAMQRADHGGIAYCRPSARTIGDIIRSLRLIHEVLEPDEMIGHIEYL